MDFYTNTYVLKLTSFVVRRLISSEIRLSGLEKIDTRKTIIYAVPSESIIDLAALNEICKKNTLPLPFKKLTESK